MAIIIEISITVTDDENNIRCFSLIFVCCYYFLANKVIYAILYAVVTVEKNYRKRRVSCVKKISKLNEHFRGEGAENAGVENAGVENAGVDSRDGKCRSGKCRSGKCRTRSHGWKMQEWKMQE